LWRFVCREERRCDRSVRQRVIRCGLPLEEELIGVDDVDEDGTLEE